MSEYQKFTTPPGVLSYPNLFAPRPNRLKPDAPAKFGCVVVFDAEAQATKEWKDLVAEVKRLALEKFGIEQKQPDGSTKRILPRTAKNPIKRGEDKLTQAGDRVDGYGDGTLFFSATSTRRPAVVGLEFEPLQAADLYPGCLVRISVAPFAYDAEGSKGIAMGLRNVQKVGDGERLGGSSNPEEDFGAPSQRTQTPAPRRPAPQPTQNHDVGDSGIPF